MGKKKSEYMTPEQARLFMAEWAANHNAKLARRNAKDAAKWRRQTRGRGPSDWPDRDVLRAYRDERTAFVRRKGREPSKKEWDELVANCFGQATTTMRDRRLKLTRKNKGFL